MQPATRYLVGIISLTAIGVAGLVTVEVTRPGDWNTALVNQIIALVAPSILMLVTLLRSVANGQAIEEASQKADAAALNAGIAADRAGVVADRVTATESTVAETAKAVKKLTGKVP